MKQGITRKYLKRKWPTDHRMHELIDYIHHVIPEIIMPDGIASGGLVTWLSGLTFSVSAVIYWLQNVLHKVPGTQITLDPADATHPRIDVIAVNDQWEVIVIKGTPAENPQKPSIDPLTQIGLTHVYIPANATEPDGVTTNLVYDENNEWATATNGVTVDFDSATDPFSGSKCADVTDIGNADTITFTASAPMQIALYKTLSLFLKLKSEMLKQHLLRVQFLLNGTPVSETCTFVVNLTLTGTWQNIGAALSDINFTGTEFDAIRFVWEKQGQQVDFAGFYVDLVKLEEGLEQPPTGIDGEDGEDGLSAYEIAVENGFTGTEQEWLDSLVGEDGTTPHIDANGNWWIGETDTGIPATGEDGREVEMQNDGTYIQWRYVGESWTNLVALSTLKGEKGDPGEPGANGQDGQDGDPGVGVPAGGATRSVLKKSSSADYDSEWDPDAVWSSDARDIVALTQTEFDALGTKVSTTLYLIID
jgi:hypothetical protein